MGRRRIEPLYDPETLAISLFAFAHQISIFIIERKMSDEKTIGGSGNYENFQQILDILQNVSKRLPKGVRLKRDKNKYLSFQITIPGRKSRVTKNTGCDLTDTGIYSALDKAWKIRKALDEFTSETEFWEWYDAEILGKNKLVDDKLTYRDIFEKIESEFWNSRNKNTKRKRSKDIPNDVATFSDYYLTVFNKFPDWDKQPSWEGIKSALFSWEQGAKKFKNAYTVIKKICSYAPNADKLLGLLSEIDAKQKIFKERQSISLNQFLEWRQKVIDEAPTEKQLEIRESWLWVCSMCVVYGLRPSEVAAIQNLVKPYSKDGVTIPALNKKENQELLILLGDKTYFGITIKTGARVCKPLISDRDLIAKLNLQNPKMPEYKPSSKNTRTITRAFSNLINQRLKSWNCPVTEAYAFRHLSNQLGEQYGIPQEIRARSLGHSVSVNESVYKDRTNFQTSVDLLTKHSKQPLDYITACNQLEQLGFDLTDKSVRAILRVIYQLDS